MQFAVCLGLNLCKNQFKYLISILFKLVDKAIAGFVTENLWSKRTFIWQYSSWLVKINLLINYEGHLKKYLKGLKYLKRMFIPLFDLSHPKLWSKRNDFIHWFSSSGLRQRISSFDGLIGGNIENVNEVVPSLYAVGSPFTKEIERIIKWVVPNANTQVNIENRNELFDSRGGLEKVTESADFHGYIQLLKIGVMMPPEQASYGMIDIFKKLYFAYFTFVDRPSAVDDEDQLNEVDRLHMKLFNQGPEHMVVFKGYEWRDKCR